MYSLFPLFDIDLHRDLSTDFRKKVVICWSTLAGIVSAGNWTLVAKFRPHTVDHYTTDTHLYSIFMIFSSFFFYSLVAMFLRFGSAVLEDNFVMDVTTRYHNYIFSNFYLLSKSVECYLRTSFFSLFVHVINWGLNLGLVLKITTLFKSQKVPF